MELNRTAGTPYYQQIKQQLKERIRQGQWLPGQRLPSEKELQEAFQVSRITVRQALNELTIEERIVRVPGKGSFVAPLKADSMTTPVGFSENMRARGLEPSYRNAQIEFTEPGPRQREMLDLPEHEKVIHICRVLLADRIPMAMQESFLPASLAAGNLHLFTSETLNQASLYTILEKNLGVPIVKSSEYVEPAIATADEAKALSIKNGDLLLLITKQIWTTDDRLVEYVMLKFRADRYRYHVMLFR